MKIVNSIWYTQMGSTAPIGIVIVEDDIVLVESAYIGVGISGNSQREDEEYIAQTGAKFDLNTARKLIFGYG